METESNAYVRVYLDKRTPECQHELAEGCYHCCDSCNYDRHRCHFCGTPTPHNGICPEGCGDE